MLLIAAVEYEERLIFDTEDIDVSNAVVGIILRATGLKGSLVKIPRKVFPLHGGVICST